VTKKDPEFGDAVRRRYDWLARSIFATLLEFFVDRPTIS
jgi:hypothetical protein